MCPRPQPQNRWSLERWRTPQSQGSLIKNFRPTLHVGAKGHSPPLRRNGQLVSAALGEVDDALGELVDQALGELVDEDLGELIGDASAD